MIKDFCSIGSTWNQNGWLKWAILGLFGLLLLALLTRCNPIESDLGNRTQALLGEKGMAWAKPSLDGRDMTITGEAPNVEARTSALELAESVYGVRTVDHDTTLKQWFSSKFNLKQDGEMVVLSGSMPDQTSIDAAVSKAHDLYGDVNVTNRLEVSDSASAPAWLAGTTSLMATLYSARNLAMTVSDDQVEISGEVETEAEKAKLIAEAQASYGDKFSESIKVVKTGPTAEELAAIAAAKLAEEQRLAEAARLAEEAEAARLAEQARLAAEAETARLAEEARLARAAAEKQRLADIKAAKAKAAAEEAALLAKCQTDFDQVLSQNPAIFNKDSSTISGLSYGIMGLLAQKVNYCSDILHARNLFIDVSAHASQGEAVPMETSIRQQRVHSAISYLEVISGAHHGLLRSSQSDKTAANSLDNSQLHFNITE